MEKKSEERCAQEMEMNTAKEETLEERKKRVFALTNEERKELRYRQFSALSFIVVMIVFGVPLWWHTTSTYRIAFRNFAPEQHITIPIDVTLGYWDRSLEAAMNEISVSLLESLRSLPHIDHLSLNFSTHIEKLHSREETMRRTDDDGRFVVRIALVSADEWSFAGNVIHFGSGTWAFVKRSHDEKKMIKRVLMAITDVLVDTHHLSVIIRRDLRRRMDPSEVAILPPNQQKRLVWDSAAQSAHHIVQVIFAHSGTDRSDDSYQPAEVMHNIRRFATKIGNITRLRVSSEHLWDFDLTAWLKKDVQSRWTLNIEDISRIIIQTDHETSTVESSYPLLKLLVLDHEEPIVLLDQTGEDSKAVVVASWGAVVSCPGMRAASVSSSVIGSLRVLLGLDTELPHGASKDPSPVADWELNRLKLRSFVDFSMNAISSVRAIHTLIEHIDNIVINEEVASAANRAVELIEEALSRAEQTGRLEIALVVEGHELAQKAVNDRSLLALLYFPSDQKFAIYLPLFLPTLLPLFGSMFALYRHCKGDE
uniref:GPI transamidase component PIG-S n=1 Tax=Parascaris univalens TaxID=6257 RepID=A0A915BLE1_PARUN